ncbi:hypothetical protein BDY21DRAFT_408530 [Lineolata rhizophorae]|uniref:Anucleate primary sterigmata protein B n=1 Tax=Lineolata rhizophorae TaxID=578093 RepID=A0A6A6P626_9PEZI|nr:hypothetical protein BDY21DRAFT_408530 [Lineolata rhizophorae]
MSNNDDSTGLSSNDNSILSFVGPPAIDFPPLPEADEQENSDLLAPPSGSGDNSNVAGANNSDGSALLDEKEMKRKLMDVESSFLPDIEHVEETQPVGTDDTYLYGGSPGNGMRQVEQTAAEDSTEDSKARNISEKDVEFGMSGQEKESQLLSSPATPADAYKTPAPAQTGTESAGDYDEDVQRPENTVSTFGTVPSSPAAAAAQRNHSRGLSNPENRPNGAAKHDRQASADDAKSVSSFRPSSRASTIKAPGSPSYQDTSTVQTEEPSDQGMDTTRSESSNASTSRLRGRPSFLRSRQTSQRSSVSSFAGRSDVSGDAGSDLNSGVDFALQSGGAAPSGSTGHPSQGLSRLPSLGSITSSMSAMSDSGPSLERSKSARDRKLHRLTEEKRSNSGSPPETPRPGTSSANFAPTDTVIAQHIQNIRVPDTVAREYREKHDKKLSGGIGGTPYHGTRSTKSNLTLKEQNSKIDKLSKENFDLKLKIHFLDQALQNRSDEGVKDMISKNVQLQTELATEKKENQSLRRKVRDLERKVKAHEEGEAAKARSSGSEDEKSDSSAKQAEMEEEILYLREVLQHHETTIEKLREENMAKEVEKRRMAAYAKSMTERKTPDQTEGVEEAIDMWKDLLEAETARREQADEDAQKLREEVERLRTQIATQPPSAVTNNHSSRNMYTISKRNYMSQATRSQSGAGSDVGSEANGGLSASTAAVSSTLVEQLRHENAELRRDLGAQTSMLTSRNRERERLQQEIEDLKLNQRREGTRSIAGDSIFERSVSRAHQRSASRASGATRVSQFSDVEREEYEKKNATLRDEISQIKLLNQDLERELNAHLDMLTQAETENRALKEEKNLTMEDLQALQAERDEALENLEDKEAECENLRDEANKMLDRLEEEIEHKEGELARIAADLDNRNEDFASLQQEMKNVSESLIQLEDDRLTAQRKIASLEQELEDTNREFEALDKRFRDACAKNERLEVQLESTQGEIAFLREEQESDKIKIGELEASLNAAQTSVQEEKERFRDLEERLAAERRQREILDSQEKEEVQKVLNDLNSQASKAKDEVRRLRKNLSSKEVEATTWKERLDDLEQNLREALGDLNGTRSSLLKDVHKLQQDLDNTLQELDNTKTALAEKERVLRNRDALLESTGLESRRLSDMLDKERQARKQDRIQFEQASRVHQSTSRTINQHETRIMELEAARGNDKRKMAHLEQQYRDQLMDRNNLLFALWNRLSTLCGAEWAKNHSLINGELPSLDVIQRNLAGFNRNIISAVKTVESIVGGFRTRIRSIEKDLWREFQTLEHALDVRAKRMDQLEKAVLANQGGGRRGASRSADRSGGGTDGAEVQRLRNENRVLRAQVDAGSGGGGGRGSSRGPPAGGRDANRASMANTLLRHHTTSAIEGGGGSSHHATTTAAAGGAQAGAAPHDAYDEFNAPLQPTEQRWIHRLKELERRLKAEREARLNDRSGARRRLEEHALENDELRRLLEREREKGWVADEMGGGGNGGGPGLGVGGVGGGVGGGGYGGFGKRVGSERRGSVGSRGEPLVDAYGDED